MAARRVLITAGPTREPLDAVRFISNASTGAQGAALAEEALARGYEVDLVHGPLEAGVPEGVNAHPVTTALEMLETCRRLHPASQFLIGAAAVSDYRPIRAVEGKRKRDGLPWMLELVPTEDILDALGKMKGTRIHAGFALETDSILENARAKLRAKGLDWLVANGPEAIGAAESSYTLLRSGGTVRRLGTISKRELARALLDAMEQGR